MKSTATMRYYRAALPRASRTPQQQQQQQQRRAGRAGGSCATPGDPSGAASGDPSGDPSGAASGEWTAWRGVATLLVFAALLAGAFAPTILRQSGARTADAAAMNEQVAAHATGLVYHRGYRVEGSWLCYGWRSGAFHCTQHWYRSASGALVSLNTAWVPNIGASATAATTVNFTPMAARPVNSYPFGQCTWGAQALSPENLNGLGNARDWLINARRRGLPTGDTPRIGATVVFQPGVQGASWLGHVGHVVAIASGGRFEMEAMNDSAGWGKFAFRWVHVGWGVGFIY